MVSYYICIYLVIIQLPEAKIWQDLKDCSTTVGYTT